MEQGAFLSSPASKGQFKDGEDTDRNSVISAQLFFLFGDDPVDTCARSFLHPLPLLCSSCLQHWLGFSLLATEVEVGQTRSKSTTDSTTSGRWSKYNNHCTCSYPFGTELSYCSSSLEMKGENCLSHHKVISREPATPCDNYVSPV